MSNLETAARIRWESYLEQVRSALASLSHDQIEEVVSELVSHLEEETASESGLVKTDESEVNAIIDRLGRPESIAEACGIESVTTGNIDIFGLSMLIASFFLVATAGFFPILQIFTITASAVLARIALLQPGVMQSPLRWAAYPGLAVAYTAIILLVLFWPLVPVLPIAATGGILPQLLAEENSSVVIGSAQYWSKVWAIAVLIAGVWWLVLTRLIRNHQPPLKQLFYPFLKITDISPGKLLIPGGLLQIAASIIVIFIYR